MPVDDGTQATFCGGEFDVPSLGFVFEAEVERWGLAYWIKIYFEVTEATITNWKTDHPDFLQSIKKGKNEADA